MNGNSGVSPYQQIVQQVKTALRLGRLRIGDQLPTVKEVVGKIAINPNTVLKAYRELETKGLIVGRLAGRAVLVAFLYALKEADGRTGEVKGFAQTIF